MIGDETLRLLWMNLSKKIQPLHSKIEMLSTSVKHKEPESMLLFN